MLRIAGKTDVGKKRTANEDGFFVAKLSEDAAYAVVCDGMGGEKGGHIASACAVEQIRKTMEESFRADFNENSMKNLMISAVSAANAQVFSMAGKNDSLKGMGTTVILAVVRGSIIHIAYAGDSRVYLVEEKGTRQLTRDHSMVQMMVDRGEISAEEAQYHPEKHYITRALGVGEMLDIDYLEEEMPDRGAVLLCSDGLSNYLDQEDLHRLVWDNDAIPAVDRLIEQANAMGGADNITAVLIAR
ncbi:MAG: Stp1/IreP family PP2C-type Ser/Thr phosphatase [Oscillospiraceae bacterium]|nr:Stp1/IreP family PP2C-type Ser/Thr phosphatase [Oscillospiraceae bacterium]